MAMSKDAQSTVTSVRRVATDGRHELRLDCRACSRQRLPARLVTTQQTVQSFTAYPVRRWAVVDAASERPTKTLGAMFEQLLKEAVKRPVEVDFAG